jgi:hypothetical protein
LPLDEVSSVPFCSVIAPAVSALPKVQVPPTPLKVKLVVAKVMDPKFKTTDDVEPKVMNPEKVLEAKAVTVTEPLI